MTKICPLCGEEYQFRTFSHHRTTVDVENTDWSCTPVGDRYTYYHY